MNRISKIIFLLCICLIFDGCNKDHDSFKTYSRPDWSLESPELLPYSFVAVIAIPDNINTYAGDDDMVAAFIDDECHGVGNLVKSDDNSKKVYYVTVRGSDTEDRNITFRYYNSRLSYLYQAKTTARFEIDGTYGSYDSPIILDLENI